MGTMVVLVESDTQDLSLDSRALAELAALGVTTLALVRDDRAVGVVLEGWAFAPPDSAAAAVAIVAAGQRSARALLPVGEMALSTPRQETCR